MDKSFWHQRWANNEIAFHASQPHPMLEKYSPMLGLKNDSRVFIPLCGKSLDISWFLSKGCRVVGVELSPLAIESLFQGLSIKPAISTVGKFQCYQADRITVFVGDFFELTEEILGAVDGVYDRAALVALPDSMRHAYTQHLLQITQKAPQLLITYEYDQKIISEPPFSISQDEVNRHYHTAYRITLLESVDVPGGLKGKCAALESGYLLR